MHLIKKKKLARSSILGASVAFSDCLHRSRVSTERESKLELGQQGEVQCRVSVRVPFSRYLCRGFTLV